MTEKSGVSQQGESNSDRAQRIASNAQEIELAAREIVAAWDSDDAWRMGRARKRLRETLAHVDAMNEQTARYFKETTDA